MTTVLIAMAIAGSLEQPQFLRYPDIHGDRVVFTSENDLWVGDLGTGAARRLTTDAGVERNAKFSPDGRSVAFEGEYDGLREAYVMSADGGAPVRLTLTDGFRAVTGWTADGSQVVFRKYGYPTNYWYYKVPASGGAPQRLPLEFASHVDMAPDGKSFAFTRFNRWFAAWWRYEGGMQNQVWVYDGAKFAQWTNEPGTCEYPVWCDGQVYYAMEKDARFWLKRVARAGARPETVFGPVDQEIRELGSDGKRVVFEVGVGAHVYDPAKKESFPVRFQMVSDDAKLRPYTVEASGAMSATSASPTGKRLLAEARGQVIDLPFGDGEARVWKSQPGVRLRWPAMSPDAKTVAYVSDEGGEQNVWTAQADGAGAKRLTNGSRRQVSHLRWSPDSKSLTYFSSTMDLHLLNVETGEDRKVCEVPYTWFGIRHDWSPDSRWIVYQDVDHLTDFGQIYLYEVATGKATLVSDARGDDFAPAFSNEGKHLAFLSQRSLAVAGDAILNQLNLGATGVVCLLPLEAGAVNPFLPKDEAEPPAGQPEKTEEPEKAEKAEKKEVEVSLEGIAARRIELPLPPGRYQAVAKLGPRVVLAGEGQITYYDIVRKAGGTITPGSSFVPTADGKKLLVDGRRIVDATGENVAPTVGLPKPGGLRLAVDPRVEWRQMFWDAWRLLRDYFYAANMHGLDWPAIGAKYAAFLPAVRDRTELDELIRWMQCELGSSHQYLSAGDVRDIKPRVPPGYLGVDLEAGEGGWYKLARIVRGDGFRTGERSPLADPSLGLKEGMYVLEIAGVPCRVGNDVFGGLVGRAGQTVGVRVNDKPSLEGSRVVYVQAVGSETRMRLLDWVESNRQYVEKASGGAVGYIYLDAMGTGDMADFVKQYFPQRGKQALLVDVRFNNGGFVQDYINRILAAKLTGFFNMRESPVSWTRQQDYFSGPMACLMNEFSISCGEEFPHRFKDLGTGPLIGRRTMGGEVGSSPGWPLADGGVVSVPNYGMWTPEDGWVIEGPGVAPDMDVPSDPNAFVAGKDPQLDAGVKWLMDEAKKRPPVKRVAPPDPVRVRRG